MENNTQSNKQSKDNSNKTLNKELNENKERLEIYQQIMNATKDIWSDDEGYQYYNTEEVPFDQIPIEFRPHLEYLDSSLLKK